MVGDGYWFAGITLTWRPAYNDKPPTWGLSLDFRDSGWCDDATSEGTLRLRYMVADLATGIDTLLADAKRLGIREHPAAGTAPHLRPTLFVNGTEDPAALPPDWREVVAGQCDRLGWPNWHREPA